MTDVRYRFWGRQDPSGRRKPAIRAERPTTKTEADGTVAVLRLYDVLDSWGGYWGTSAREFQEALDSVGDVDRIRLHLNSPGGEVYEGVAIMNALRAHPAKVTAVVDGLAASAASFIAAGVDELVMRPQTELMIHDAWGIGIGPAATMRDLADRLDKVSDNIASVYARKSGTDVLAWRAAMLAETWYSPEEAVDAGLADRVDDFTDEGQEEDGELIAASFDRSQFQYRGRADAPPPGSPEDTAALAGYWARRHRMNAGRFDGTTPLPVVGERFGTE